MHICIGGITANIWKADGVSMKKTLMIILIVLLVLAAAGFGVFGVFKYYSGKLQKNNTVEIVEKPVETEEVQQVLFFTPDPDAVQVTQTPEPEPSPSEQPIYAVDQINANIINILLVGIDPRDENANADSTGNSDSMMLISCNLDTKRVCIFSLMRDGAAYINDKSGWYDKLNKAYSNGGIGMLINTLNGKRNFQLDIQNYVSITFSMFEHIIDTFGGLDVDLTEEECKFINKKIRSWHEKNSKSMPETYTQVEVFDGPHHLTGETALWYARDRYSGGTSDYGRTGRQRHLLELLYKKVKQEWTIGKLMDVINYVADNAATNLSADALVQLATIALSNDFTIESSTIPFPGTGHNGENGKGKYLLTYNMEETRDILKGIIYNNEPFPEGKQTDFTDSNED